MGRFVRRVGVVAQLHVVLPVAPAEAVDVVQAVAAAQNVVAGAAVEHVVAIRPGEEVVAVAPEQDVVAIVPIEAVVAAQAADRVGALRAADRVVARAAREQLAQDRLQIPHRAIGERHALHRVVGVARVVVQEEAAHDHLVLRARDGDFQAHVAAGPAVRHLPQHDVLGLHALLELQRVLPVGRGVHGIGIVAQLHIVLPVAPAEAIHVVQAVAAAQRVVARAAVEHVIATLGGDEVVAVAAQDHVVAVAPIEAVVAAQAADRVGALRAHDGVVACAAREQLAQDRLQVPHRAIGERHALHRVVGIARVVVAEEAANDHLVLRARDGDFQAQVAAGPAIRHLPQHDVLGLHALLELQRVLPVGRWVHRIGIVAQLHVILPVAPAEAVHVVQAVAAAQRVVARAAIQHVVPALGGEEIVAVAAQEDVVAITAVEAVVAPQAADRVGVLRARDRVAARAAREHPVQDLLQVPHRAVGERDALHRVVGAARVVIQEEAADDHLVLRAGDGDFQPLVAAGPAVRHLPQHDVLGLDALLELQRVLPVGRLVHRIDVMAQLHVVLPVAPAEQVHVVQAIATAQRVVARPAVEHVVAALGGEEVVALAAQQRVAAVAAIEAVVPGAAGESVIAALPVQHVIARASEQPVVALPGRETVVARVPQVDVAPPRSQGLRRQEDPETAQFRSQRRAFGQRMHPAREPIQGIEPHGIEHLALVAVELDQVHDRIALAARLLRVQQGREARGVEADTRLVDGQLHAVQVGLEPRLHDQGGVHALAQLLVALRQQFQLRDGQVGR
ncbi:hypothetical protein ACAN107058_13765 [Paracidovorax anthurii]